MEMFDQIPLACLLNKKFLLVHGGISHDLKTVNLRLISLKTSKRLNVFDKYLKVDFFVIWFGQTLWIIKMGLVMD